MKVVVIGGTGNVGTALIRRLTADAQTQVVGVARHLPKPGVRPYDKVEWVKADIGNPLDFPALVEAMHGATAVVDAAWAVQPTHDPAKLARTNVEGTQRVLDAARAAKVEHLTFLSSFGVYSPGAKDRPVDESWPADGIPSSTYSKQKATAERLIDIATEDGSGPVVARMRPAIILQAEAGRRLAAQSLGLIGSLIPAPILAQVLTDIRVPGVPLVLPLDQTFTFQVVHADDVADAIVRAIERRAGGAFNLAAEPAVTPEALGNLLDARVIEVDKRLVRTVVDLAWRLRLQPTDAGWLDMLTTAPLLDTTRARTELDWKASKRTGRVLNDVLGGMARGSGAGPVLGPDESLPARVTERVFDQLSNVHLPALPSMPSIPFLRGRGE